MSTRTALLMAVLLISLSMCSSLGEESESRAVVDNTLNLQERWRHASVFIEGYEDPELLAASGDLISVQYTRHNAYLKVLEAVTGNLAWETLVYKEGAIDTLAIDTERVYVMAHFEIHAYDLDNGNELWKSKLPAHRVYALYSDGEELYARDIPEAVYSFNARTGEQGKTISATSDEFVLLSSSPSFDLHVSPIALKLQDRITQQTLWVSQLEELRSIQTYPVLFQVIQKYPVLFHEDAILVGWGFAVDVQSGRVEWYKQDIVSNFVILNDSLYALDANARLVRLDVGTGQETGYIQFTPPRTDPREESYWVAADGQMLFVYFGDSQELIALGP
jgi:outer membrane protein assembly factor BamB